MFEIMRKATLGILATTGLALIVLAGCGTAGNNANPGNTGSGSSNQAAGSGKADKVSAINITPTVNSDAMPKSETIVVGVDNTYPPMEFMNADNRLVGFDVDLGDEIGKELNMKVVWKPTAWDGIISGLKANKYDAIISTMNITADREKQIQFVKYGDFGQVIIQPTNAQSPVTALGGLKGKTVGVQLATTSEDAVKKEGGIKIKEYNTFPDAFQDLSAGRIAAAVVDEPVGLYYVSKQPDNYHVAGKVFDSEPVGIGLRKNETDLDKKIQQALNQMHKDGTYNKIYKYWFGTSGK